MRPEGRRPSPVKRYGIPRQLPDSRTQTFRPHHRIRIRTPERFFEFRHVRQRTVDAPFVRRVRIGFQALERLFRTREGRLVAGVCTGIAAYFGIDPTLVRLAFALSTVFLVLLAAASPARSQPSPARTGTLRLIVRDATELPIAGADVVPPEAEP